MRTSLLEQTEKNSAREHFSALSLRISPSSVLIVHRCGMFSWTSTQRGYRKDSTKLITDGDDVVAKSETGLLASSHPHIGLVRGLGITTKDQANDFAPK